MADFPVSVIELRKTTDIWGPFNFNVADAIPSGDTVDSFTVGVYEGLVGPFEDLTVLTNVSADFIDSGVLLSTNGSVLAVHFQWPGSAYSGKDFTLVFNLTLTDNAGKHPLFFHHIKVW